jgi:hypothetical protein
MNFLCDATGKARSNMVDLSRHTATLINTVT